MKTGQQDNDDPLRLRGFLTREGGASQTAIQVESNAAHSGDLGTAILGHAMLRIAGSASSVLIGVYLAQLGTSGFPVDASLIGLLGATSFAAELLASIPFGWASDAIAPRWLMLCGALVGAVGVWIFALAPHVGIFFLSRTLEGMAAAAVTPPLLAFLAASTSQNAGLRARVMSFFELSLLAGLALGGVVGSQFWVHFRLSSFSFLALAYSICAVFLFVGARKSRSRGSRAAVHGLKQALQDPAIRTLAPVWLCVNAVVGLWLGPTTTFLLTQKPKTTQFLDGIYAAAPSHVGWLLLGYTCVFGAGVFCWSFVLPRMAVRSAMHISLVAMVPVCFSLFAFNHSGAWSPAVRIGLLVVTALFIMVESGFTPAALAWLAGTLVKSEGKGVAMGIYSVLLGIGAIVGSLLAGWLGKILRFDGLLLGTVGLAIVALFLLRQVTELESREASHETA